jgi:hypothetical protein
MRSLTRPQVNIRMLVLDICEVTGLKEDEVISSLCDRFEDNFINHRNREPIYLKNNGYRLPHTYALVFLWSILDKQFKWDDVIDKVLGVDNKWIKRSIPFEQFNLSCQDLLLLFPKNILAMEKLGL